MISSWWYLVKVKKEVIHNGHFINRNMEVVLQRKCGGRKTNSVSVVMNQMICKKSIIWITSTQTHEHALKQTEVQMDISGMVSSASFPAGISSSITQEVSCFGFRNELMDLSSCCTLCWSSLRACRGPGSALCTSGETFPHAVDRDCVSPGPSSHSMTQISSYCFGIFPFISVRNKKLFGSILHCVTPAHVLKWAGEIIHLKIIYLLQVHI